MKVILNKKSSAQYQLFSRPRIFHRSAGIPSQHQDWQFRSNPASTGVKSRTVSYDGVY